MNDLRKDRRAPASLKVKYKSATVAEFIEQFGSDISRGGIFIKTKKPLDTGALLKFEFQLQGGAPVIYGVGRVAWRRTEERARADLPAGMGIKFIKLDDQSRAVIERVEARHGAGSRFEQTEAAELAPPLSSLPPNAALNAIATPPAPPPSVESARRPPPAPPRAAEPSGDKPTFRPPPPPATSSVPPALADGWPSTAPKPKIAPPQRSASAPQARTESAPKGVLGSFSPESPTRRTGPSVRSNARDASEFLASAFSVGGAGHDTRAAARVQVERARRDPESVDLANELFGDLNEEPKPSRAQSEAGEAERDAKSAMLDSLGPPSDPKPLTPQERSLSEKIPSIEDLVNEVTHDVEPLPAPAISARASNPGARGNGLDTGAAEVLAAAAPLSLALAQPQLTAAAKDLDTFRPPARTASGGPLVAILAGILVLAIAGAAVLFFRGSHREVVPPPTAASEARAEPSAPSPPPPLAAKAAASAPQPSAAPDRAVAAPVEVNVTSEPRGAELLADGKAAGTTPATLSLPAGVAVELRLHSPGYATKTERVTPQAGMPAQHFALEPLPFELQITTDPEGATVRVKNLSAVSPAPIALGHVDGVLNATIEKDGYQRMARNVRLDEFHEQDGAMRAELTLSLTPSPSAPRRRAASRAAALPPPPEPSSPSSPSATEPVIQVKPEPSAEEKPSEPATPAPKAEAPPPPAAPEAPPAPAP